MAMTNELAKTIALLVVRGKGILAADESQSTIAKRFASIKVEPSEENRRAWREVLLTTTNLGNYITGVILFEETLLQKTAAGVPFVEVLKKQGIVPGIKVDKGLIPFESSPNEKTSQGLDGLPDRLVKYKEQGARFAKFRVIYEISNEFPSRLLIKTNAEVLARYAAICQAQGIVPIVEPEVLIDGNHSIDQCAVITEIVQNAVFRALYKHKVLFEYMILKPSMVIDGKECQTKSGSARVAEETVRILRRTTPAAVPSINFLSGGQSAVEATENLNAINSLGVLPWYVSFSYSRALQDLCLKAWGGNHANVANAQKLLLKRAELNGLAALGKYKKALEQ